VFHNKKSNAITTVIIAIMILLGTATIVVYASNNTIVSIDPSSQIVSPGQTFTVNVSCVPEEPIKSFEFKLAFDASLLQANSVTEGDIFDGYTTFFNAGTINNLTGTIVDIYGLILGAGSVSDSGTFVSISFIAKDITGTSNLDLYDVGVTNSTAYISIDVNNGSVSIEEYTLTITTVGSGSVTKDPDQGSYVYGDVVELTAVADDGWSFVGWSGDLSGSDNPDSVTITGDMSVVAHFIDSNSSEISNIDITTSNPLDTDSSFGWINITCIVTDNVAVNGVSLNITNSDGSYNNNTINAIGANSYYYNSSAVFSTYGNYSYFIWANDTTNNQNTSSIYTFSMPPNWDINNDGDCNVYDLVLVSNYYNETGTSGWIREDVDNNGRIQVIDLVLISGHYDESWWQ